MAKLVKATCPSCGAAVRLDPSLEFVTCTYCGVSSFIERAGQATAVHRPPEAPVIRVEAPRSNPVPVLVGFGALGALLLTGAAAALTALNTPHPGPQPGPQPSPADPDIASDPAPSTGNLPSRLEHTRPLLAGDAERTLLVPVGRWQEPKKEYAVAAFDGKTGTPLWESRGFARSTDRRVMSTSELALVAAETELHAFELRTGDARFVAKFDEKIAGFCASASPGKLRVRLSDERRFDVNVRDGALASAARNAPCGWVATDQPPSTSVEPEGRRDAVVFPDVEAWRCGSVRVMGDRNFFVPDRCGKTLAAARRALEGFEPATMLKRGSAWVLVGAKAPGTAVPKVGVVSGSALRWSAELPQGDPLQAKTGAPEIYALGPSELFVVYTDAAKLPRLAAFELEGGARRFDVVLSSEPRFLQLDGGTLYVAGKTVSARRASDGGELWALPMR